MLANRETYILVCGNCGASLDHARGVRANSASDNMRRAPKGIPDPAGPLFAPEDDIAAGWHNAEYIKWFRRCRMQDPYTILLAEAQRVPDWLCGYTPERLFPRDDFFASRIVFYPGSGDDGHPLKLFGGTHAAHCFVFADFGVPQETFVRALSDQDFTSEEGHPRFPKGYRALTVVALRERDVVPNGWTARTHSKTYRLEFAIWAVMDRRAEFDDDHGPARLAILVIGMEAIATFDVLFCQPRVQLPPYAIVLQDHGFGGNSRGNEFGGQDSRLWGLAKHKPAKWLLVADGTCPWPGYERISSGDRGGRHCNARALYVRELGDGGA